ncbi:hypothetical protein C1645_813516 [Glomus cerebriforme]|uniref:Uncharacterized protein n=1 Tax=Glomus cerebriforme TaxID=658196 RepID=A0A397TJ03_9GLOM|nr:hypothetical protein C1645_813516 [Glomus cerebriforme]
MSFNERSPLIPFDDDEEDISFLQKAFTIICFVIALAIVVLMFISPHDIAYRDLPNDISSVPYQYLLSHKSFLHFGYLVETLPVEFNGDDQPEYVLLAEIVSVSSSWTLGNYEVLEYRQNITYDDLFPVKTAVSSLSFWMNDVHISFKRDPFNYTSKDSELFDLIIPELCDYKITWNWIFNGNIFRRCELANETSYYLISHVDGSTAWGLKFYNDNGDVYASTSETQYWWNMNRRDVKVEPFAPFPPIMPAIYTAYYDTIQRNHESRRH